MAKREMLKLDDYGSLSDFAKKAGVSVSYACQLLSEDENTRRRPSVEKALTIYERTKFKFGILEGASPAEIAAILRMARRTGVIA